MSTGDNNEMRFKANTKLLYSEIVWANCGSVGIAELLWLFARLCSAQALVVKRSLVFVLHNRYNEYEKANYLKLISSVSSVFGAPVPLTFHSQYGSLDPLSSLGCKFWEINKGAVYYPKN